MEFVYWSSTLRYLDTVLITCFSFTSVCYSSYLFWKCIVVPSHHFTLFTADVTTTLVLDTYRPTARGSRKVPARGITAPSARVPTGRRNVSVSTRTNRSVANNSTVTSRVRVASVLRSCAGSVAEVRSRVVVNVICGSTSATFTGNVLKRRHNTLSVTGVRLGCNASTTVQRLTRRVVATRRTRVSVVGG